VEQQAHSFGAMSSCLHCGAPFTAVIAGQTLCDRCQGLAHPEPRSPLQEAEIAGLRLLHELGAGRFSHSWLGEDARSHAVVLKLLRRYAPDPEAVQRFLAEAERLVTIADLDHPYVARPLWAGVHLVQAFFLVYESGGELTLADELRQHGRVRAARALELCAQICEGLGAVHRAGVLHLDLKPANVGLTRLSDGTEQAALLDAVTSHLLHHVGLRDGHPIPIATAAYTAPEQAAGEGADERSDLYSVGVLLFQLLSGRLPVSGATPQELLRAHREHATLGLRDIGRRVHPELEETVARLMAKDPAGRPESGDEAAVMLRAMAALAEATPLEDEVHQDNPLPLARLRPVPAAPPQMLPPAVDPDLERAMLGHVSAAPPEWAPGIPKWAAFVPPRWWPLAAALTLAIAAAVVVGVRTHMKAGASPIASTPGPAVLPATEAAPAQAPSADAPPEVAAARAEPPRPSKLAQNAASPWAKNFDRAQKALWTNRAGGAETILRDILKKPGLTRRDRARASRMMGEAEAKKGNRAKATQWWQQAFQLFDDPEERAKVARLIQGLPR
jgi:serine/threonine protein kinase